MPEIDNARIVEQAQVAKLNAETRQIEAELAGRQNLLERVTNWLKVIGTTIAAVTGIYAGIKTYEIDVLQTKIAQAAKRDAEEELSKARAGRDQERLQLAATHTQLTTLQESARTLESDLLAKRTELTAVAESAARIRASLSQCGEKQAGAALGHIEARASSAARSATVMIRPAVQGQTTLAQTIKQDLTEAGYRAIVKSPLNDPTRAPNSTEIRYFQKTDDDEAGRLADLVRDAGVDESRRSFVNDPDITWNRYFEVRLSR